MVSAVLCRQSAIGRAMGTQARFRRGQARRAAGGARTDRSRLQLLQGAARAVADGAQDLRGLVYPDLWPGIDLVYEGAADRMKYSFVVKPGADPGQIKLAYRGAYGVRDKPGRAARGEDAGGQPERRAASLLPGGGRAAVEVASGYRLEAEAERGRGPTASGWGSTTGAGSW